VSFYIASVELPFDLSGSIFKTSQDDHVLSVNAFGRPSFVEVVEQYPDGLFETKIGLQMCS
jgi:hypothetical protein